ncbi:hypothetical protein HanRHA438_Chr07g0324101 [Helianthus annuus]|nr:hypothetical protein HanRHA438_Chr07g0324101 [Helianthus annuus]
MLRFESSSGILFTFLFFFIFNSNPTSCPTSFTDLRRLISHILSSFSILISDLYRNLSYNIIQFYSQNSPPNHRFRGEELLSCLKVTVLMMILQSSRNYSTLSLICRQESVKHSELLYGLCYFKTELSSLRASDSETIYSDSSSIANPSTLAPSSQTEWTD